MIPVEGSFPARCEDPEYERAYNALEAEFMLAAAMIEARARAGLTPQQLAEARLAAAEGITNRRDIYGNPVLAECAGLFRPTHPTDAAR
jgi:hypothetical protein